MYNFITVYSFTLYLRYIGESLNGKSLETSGNLAILTFKTNGRVSGKGFKATISKVCNELLYKTVKLAMILKICILKAL